MALDLAQIQQLIESLKGQGAPKRDIIIGKKGGKHFIYKPGSDAKIMSLLAKKG